VEETGLISKREHWSRLSRNRDDNSDVDLMVRFSKRKSLLSLVKIEREISTALGRKVDLLTEAAISPYLKDRIMKELMVLYEE
jgi:predicted nucleotidyltransferase